MVTVDGDCHVNKSDKNERLYQRGREGGKRGASVVVAMVALAGWYGGHQWWC